MYCQSFYALYLIPIWVDPNDTSLMIDSDVELTLSLISWTQFIFTMYNGLQCLPMQINHSNLCIRFSTLKVQPLK